MKIGTCTAALLFATATVAVLPACGGESSNTEVKSPETTSAPVGRTSTATETVPLGPASEAEAPRYATPALGPAAAAAGTPGAAQSTETATAATSLNDAQVAELASDVNQAEIDQARLAVSHVKTPQVAQLAKHMLSDHQGIGQRMTALLLAQGIHPAGSGTSAELQSNAKQTLSSLQGKSGADLERDYVDAQIREHKEALELFDNKLIPNAKDPQLKAYLEEVRAKVASHLALAQSVQNSLVANK